MTIHIQIKGRLIGNEPIKFDIEVPPNWKPSFKEITVVKGAIRIAADKLGEQFGGIDWNVN